MAVEKHNKDLQLKLINETEKIKDNKPVLRTVTYADVDTQATNLDIFATAYAIKDLQKDKMLEVNLDEKSLLTEVEG